MMTESIFEALAVRETLAADLSNIPEGWWLYGLFHNHTPIRFAGEKHVPFDKSGHGFAWSCKLQHVCGGKLTEGRGDTPQQAIRSAIQEIEVEIEIGILKGW